MTTNLSAELLERDLQARCVAWWNQSGLPGLLFHVPNEGKRNRLEAASLAALGVIAGVADLVLLLPNGRVHLIELKTESGTMSPEQGAFRRSTCKLGHTYSVVRTLVEFRWDVTSAIRYNEPDGSLLEIGTALPLP